MTKTIARLQRKLDASSSPRVRDWWTRYLKGAIRFRGLGIPSIRRVVSEWREEEGIAAVAPAAQFELALALMREPVAEDKLAGILYIQQYLLGSVPWREAVPRYAELFERGCVFEWSTCDWFCVRVLGPTIARGGLPCARAIGSWRRADNLWQARASAVAFVYLVGDDRFHEVMERSCAALIVRDERFAKTAVGWVMRELSRHDAPRVERFVRAHRLHFSTESFRSATARLRRAPAAPPTRR